MSCRVLPSAIVLALALTGCFVDRHIVWDSERNRVMRAEPGDRFYFSLDEKPELGGHWLVTSDDPDVEALVEHLRQDGVAKVRLRVAPGYDGPTTVTFSFRQFQTGKELKHFTVGLFRRTGDTVFWK